MPNKENTPKNTKQIGDYFRLMRDAKKSGAIGRIFDALNSIERIDQAHHLIPSKFHVAASLYTSPATLGTNLLGELIWGSIVIQRKRDDIEQYLELKRTLEVLILQSKWNEALSRLLEFELRHGTASVIKELAIAITQQAEGTAKQVSYSRRLEAQCTVSAATHIFRRASERNEDRLTLSGFRRNFREHYSTATTALASAIIHWHGLHQVPNDEELLSQLLSFEGSGSIFDYFEAFIAIAVHLAARSSSRVRTTLKNSLQRLSEISDQRILNLRRLLADQYKPQSTALTAANVLSEIRERSNFDEIVSPTEQMILDLFNDNLPEGDIRRNVHKLSANFYHLDFFQAVFSHLEHKASIDCFDQAVAPGLSALANTTSIRSVFGCSFLVAREIFEKSSLATDVHSISNFSNFPFDEKGADSILFTAIALAKKGEIDRLIGLVHSSNLNAIDRSHLQLIAIKACYEHGKFVDLLQFALEVSEIRLDALSLVPIVKALEEILPGRLSSRNAVLFSIVTSRVLLIEDSDRLEDKLMVAAEVAFSDKNTPPEWTRENESSLRLWIGFLRDVLVVQNMLLIDDVNSLSDALNLRVEVLRQLEELDPENRVKYHEEVRDIAFSLSVDEGIRQVNSSRLNVNSHGLAKWANEHCIDDYERYKELVIGEGSVGDISINLSGSVSILDQFAVIPFGIADDQLVKLLIRIRNAYLSDPRNGLDAYISLRVRHGSLSGTLSSGLDTRQLLLLRKSENGPFEAPNYWIGRLDLSNAQVTEVTKAFAIFTTTFRKSIDELLQNRLRVKNDRHAQGEITVEITEIFVKGLKIDIVGGLSFDAFISTVFIAYKNTVSAYLDSLRKYLRTDFLNNAIEALETLSTNVGMTINDNEKHNYLNDAITNARLDLQASIRVICGWLEIAQKEDLAQLYTLNQAAEIGINYTRQVRNNFSPNISMVEVDESFRVTGASLIVIVDILFILLDNVYKHAGSPNDRSITLSFDMSEDRLIKISMRNDLDAAIDRQEVALRLEAARKLIADSEGERKLTEEDRSGLPKLSRLVAQDRVDALIFDLVGDQVEVTVLVGYASLEIAV